MMKLFFAGVLWVLVLLTGGTVPAQPAETKSILCQKSSLPAHDHFIYSSSYSGIFNSAVNEENQASGQQLAPSFNRIPSSPRLTEKYAESIRNHEISGYICLALFHIKRFEGPGIIHPFDYFW